MHIILGALGVIVTILILLNRLSDAGIDIGWLDPFKWKRRHSWSKRYHANPTYCIDDPMEATAGLMYTMIKCSGDITMEEKAFLLTTFEKEFQLSPTEAAQLLSSCNFLIKDEKSVTVNLKKFLKPSFPSFSSTQKESAYAMLKKTAYLKNEPNDFQKQLLSDVRNELCPQVTNKNWK